MKHWFFLDNDGYVELTGFSPIIPDGATEGELDLPPAPDSGIHKFNYQQNQWVFVETAAQRLAAVRAERSMLLAKTDWTQLADVPAPTRAMWQPYRQALRDITNQPDPFTIVWPTRPE